MQYNKIKIDAMGFLEDMRIENTWQFKFSNINQPNLIASSLAVMLGSLVGWLDHLSDQEKKSWAKYLNSFQREDGFFVDEDISDANRVTGYTYERAIFHRSRHALFALSTLGFKPRYNFTFLKDKLCVDGVKKWMKNLILL